MKQSKSTLTTEDKLNFPIVELRGLISSDLMSSGDLNYGIMLIMKENYRMSQDKLMEFISIFFSPQETLLFLIPDIVDHIEYPGLGDELVFSWDEICRHDCSQHN